MANKHMKRCWTLLSNEKHNEIISNPPELLKLERLTTLNVSEEIELLELSYIAGGYVK